MYSEINQRNIEVESENKRGSFSICNIMYIIVLKKFPGF